MSENRGWIAIKRQIQDHWIWLDNEPFDRRSAWIDLIMMANHQDAKFLHGNKLEEVKRGSKITSLRQLASRWKWSVNKVKRFLTVLEEDNMIKVKSDSKKTTYTIVNYNTHQDIEKPKKNSNGTLKEHNKNNRETQVEHQRETNGTSTETNNNDNNDNNDNKTNNSGVYDSIIDLWNSLDNNIPKITTLNPGTVRHTNLKSRINQFGESKVIEAINKISESGFLKGYVSDFKITFDWFVKPNNFIKVLEGNYDDNKSVKQPKNISPGTTLYEKDKRTTYEDRQEYVNRKLREPIPINRNNRR